MLFEDVRAVYLEKMDALLKEGHVVAVVRAWGYFVALLGSYLFKSNLLNTLLKIPEKTFTHSTPAVRTVSFVSWTYPTVTF